MTLNPARFNSIEGPAVAEDPLDRAIDAKITQSGEDNFELLLQSIGFPFSPSRTFNYSSRAALDAALVVETKRFLDHLVACVDRE